MGKLYIPPMTRTDKLLLLALAGCFLAPHLAVWALDEAAYRAAEDKPPVEIVEAAPAIDFTPLVDAVEEAIGAVQGNQYDEAIPLSPELQAVLRESCEASGVPFYIAVGVIDVESGFKADSKNGLCVGLMQLNERYVKDYEEATGYSIYTPEGNIRGGVWFLGELIRQYDGDFQAALTAYNAGSDTGDRVYALKVLAASEKCGNG